MAFRPFILSHVYEKQATSKEKGKSGIHCIECYDRNVYIGARDALIQHFILTSNTDGDLSLSSSKLREGRARKLGSSSPVAQLRTVPIFNHLLVLWDRSISALNMFSLEPLSALKKIQHVSLFEVCDSSAQTGSVEMVTASSRRKVIRIFAVGVDRWEVVREVPMHQDPVALAVDGASLCVATSDRYLLCDTERGSSEELFPHDHNRQHVVVTSVGPGEFLLNGPEYLGMFVMKTGICQRPPLQWPQEVLAARVCFPYILTLQPQMLSVYSMLDQQCKQTVSLSEAKGLLSTSDGALVFTERDIFSLSMVPFREQIQALAEQERFEEALLLLEGIQSHRPLDSHKELQKAITCLAGFAHFYQEGFSDARDLFIKGDLDPREIIRLYPDMQLCLAQDFQSRLDQRNKSRDLQVLWQEDRNTFHHYLEFLGDLLRAVRGTEQSLKCGKEVDSALLRLYVILEDTENLQQLVDFPNECSLEYCIPVLEQNDRLFALGSLYKSHGMETEALKTWMKTAEDFNRDPACSDVYGHIVKTLSELKSRDIVWAFADWTLQQNQETGVQIFTKRPPDDLFDAKDVLTLLHKYPLALLLYLEFLINDLNNEEERYHNCLALAYVTQALTQEEETESDVRVTRGKLQQLLWESKFYNISVVYESVKSTTLHNERAILLGRSGDHLQALQTLVHREKDLQAAEVYCCRAAQGQDLKFKEVLFLTLLQIYLSSQDLVTAAVDLLNSQPQVFSVGTVIQLLPETWSIQLVSQFLVRSYRQVFHQRQMVRLQKALSQAELLKHKAIWIQTSKTVFRVAKDQRCSVCQRQLAEPQFSRNLQGELIHVTCTGCSA